MITSIIRPHNMHALMHRCGLLLQMNRGLSVCLCLLLSLTTWDVLNRMNKPRCRLGPSGLVCHGLNHLLVWTWIPTIKRGDLEEQNSACKWQQASNRHASKTHCKLKWKHCSLHAGHCTQRRSRQAMHAVSREVIEAVQDPLLKSRHMDRLTCSDTEADSAAASGHALQFG